MNVVELGEVGGITCSDKVVLDESNGGDGEFEGVEGAKDEGMEEGMEEGNVIGKDKVESEVDGRDEIFSKDSSRMDLSCSEEVVNIPSP